MTIQAQGTFLQELGPVLLARIPSCIIVTLFYGVFLVLASRSIHAVLNRGLTTRVARATLIIILISFLLTTVYWITTVATIVMLIQSGFVKEGETSLNMEDMLMGVYGSPGIVGAWAAELLPVASSVVFGWRACALFPRRRWVVTVFGILLLGMTVTIFFHLVLISLKAVTTAANLSLFFSISLTIAPVINAFATSLITYKLWVHRKATTHLSRRKSYVQNILLFFVESGAIYCVLQLTTMVMSILRPGAIYIYSATSLESTVFYSTYTMLSAMYPAIGVVLTDIWQRSLAEANSLSIVSNIERIPDRRPVMAGVVSSVSNRIYGANRAWPLSGYALNNTWDEDNTAYLEYIKIQLGEKTGDTCDRHTYTSPF